MNMATSNLKIICLLQELQRLALIQGFTACKCGTPLEKLEEFDAKNEQSKRTKIYTDLLEEFNKRVIDVGFTQ
jgi:hypothetical protein